MKVSIPNNRFKRSFQIEIKPIRQNSINNILRVIAYASNPGLDEKE